MVILDGSNANLYEVIMTSLQGAINVSHEGFLLLFFQYSATLLTLIIRVVLSVLRGGPK